MRTVNRAAILVRPKEPYLAWAAGLDDADPDVVEVLRNKTSVYLVAQDPEGRQESAPIEGYSQIIFEAELEAWYRDASTWPSPRDHATFLEWFEVEAESIVRDLEPSRIKSELDPY